LDKRLSPLASIGRRRGECLEDQRLKKGVEGDCDKDEQESKDQGLIVRPSKASTPPLANLVTERHWLARLGDLHHEIVS
jgi:hypothetical protein